MNRTWNDTVRTFLLTLILTACLVFGAVFGLAAAYRMPFRERELAELLMGGAILFSAAGVLHDRLPKAIRIVTAVFAAAGLCGLLWFCRREIAVSLLGTSEILASTIGSAYGALTLTEPVNADPAETDATAVLELAGLLLTWAAARCLARENAGMRANLLAILLCPVLVLQMIVVDRAPAPWTAALTLCGCFGTLLCWKAKESRAPGTALILILPAALAASAAFLFPTETYAPPAWRKEALEQMAELYEAAMEKSGKNRSEPSSETLGSSSWNESVDRVALDDVGPREKNGAHVMDVFADEDIRCYLFGAAYGIYDGVSWSPVKQRSYSLLRLSEKHWLTDGYGGNTVWIRTERPASILYLPYGFLMTPDGAAIRYDSCIYNEKGLRNYMIPVGEGVTGFASSASYRSFVQANYTDVPDETEEALAGIVAELKKKTASLNTEETAEAVAEYVRSSAEYDADTPRMTRRNDFVSWFLLESDAGYCVHFASAAAILLRCLDIPARYVTGYAAYLPGGEWIEITEDQAHAWTEYYRDGAGWTKLEATASYELIPPPPVEKPEVEVVFVPEEEMDLPEPSESRKEETEETPPEEEDAPLPAAQTGGRRRSADPFLLAAAFVPAVYLLWQLLTRLTRRLLLNRGSPEKRACRIFRCAEKLAGLTGEGTPIPDEVRIPAERARFGCPSGGRNAVSEEELANMRNAVRLMRRSLFRKKSVGGRLWLILRHAL